MSINFLIDGKFGGDVISVTEAVNDKFGVSQASADARNTNGGMINVVDESGVASQLTAKDYYNQVGGRDGLLGEYVYNATNITLRELSIGYVLPSLVTSLNLLSFLLLQIIYSLFLKMLHLTPILLLVQVQGYKVLTYLVNLLQEV